MSVPVITGLRERERTDVRSYLTNLETARVSPDRSPLPPLPLFPRRANPLDDATWPDEEAPPRPDCGWDVDTSAHYENCEATR
jgi:hypothetical protein